MSVKNILSYAAPKMGLNPAQASQRAVLLRFLNEAADEMYTQADIAGSLMEHVFMVNGNQTISLPHYVGEVRAIREYFSQIPWSINQMRPRYNQSNWPDMWRNWRLLNRSPLQRSITNESIVNVVVPFVENPPITVTVAGATATASNVQKVITCSALINPSVNQFLDISSVEKSKVTTYDVTITDVDGEMLTVIPNTELQAWYQVVDVSTLPWLTQRQSNLEHYVEVLYKKALLYLSSDGDEYPAQGFDIILGNKMLQLWAQEEGKADLALQYDKLTSRSMARKHENANRATEDSIGFVFNPHDSLLPRVRARRPGRYGGYGAIVGY